MQLNENKNTNAIEICRLFNISPNIINGKAKNDEFKNSFKTGVIPVLRAIECACNRDVLLEKEKPQRFWAFDTKEMLKENIKERFEAWSQAIDSNFMQIDEVRYEENLPPLGIKWIKLGLDSVLYDPKSGEIYTPNTSVSQNIGNLDKKKVETADKADSKDDLEENTGNVEITQEGTVASISLNGAQIQSLLQIVTAVAANQLQYDSAIVLITSAFPFDEQVAKSILGNPDMLKVPGEKGGEVV
jgi:hypothetical protein